MSTGFKAFNVDLGNYFQPYFSGSDVQELSGIKINGVQAFARRDNNPSNAPTVFNTGYKYNGVDISSYANKLNASLTIQLSGGSTTYNGQGQQATITLVSPTNSWITVTTSTQTDAQIYNQSDFTYNSPTGYILSVDPSFFIINPSPLNIASNGGSTSFTWNGSAQTFSNYIVTGNYPQDSGWSVGGITETAAGNYTAYISILSNNYSLGITNTLSWSIQAIAPSTPTIGTSSSGDKSFTANWTASASTGGATVTYYVSYSTDGGNVWSAESTTTSTTYTWSGNGVIYNGNNYIAKVRATNSSNLYSGYSGNSVGVVPTFAAPTIQSINFAAPSLANPNVRPFTVTFTPSPCVNYSITRIYVQNETLESPFILGYYDSVNGGLNNFFTQTTGQQTTGTVSSVYAQPFMSSAGFFTNGNSVTFKVYVITYNNDGWPVQSSTISGTSPAQQSTYTFNPNPVTTANAISLYSTGAFSVNSNSFSQISSFTPNNDQNIVKLIVTARTATLASSINITSAGRTFTAGFSGTTTSTFSQTLSGSQAPWNNNNASVSRSLEWNTTDTGFNNSAGGRIRVLGGGSIGTFAAGQVIQVTFQVFGQTRTLVYY